MELKEILDILEKRIQEAENVLNKLEKDVDKYLEHGAYFPYASLLIDETIQELYVLDNELDKYLCDYGEEKQATIEFEKKKKARSE